ncbi:MAG TPA: hypothetical protein VK941_09035 [Gillisia sp.]|nr:hypothetical protein [Gillisia sp.]
MGRIEDNKKKRKDTDTDPLKNIGNRDRPSDIDTGKKTIKDQQDKK